MVQRQDSVCRHCGALQVAAPWEQELPPVPFIDATSPLSSTERDALSSLWAAKETDSANLARMMDSPQPSATSSFSISTPHHKQRDSWSQGNRSSQEISPRTLPAIDGPEGAAKISKSRAASPNITVASPTLGRIEEDLLFQALPGTMSTKTKTTERIVTHRRPHSLNGDLKKKKRRSGLPTRLRSTLRDFFKKDLEDESMFEHVDYHHWTEDD